MRTGQDDKFARLVAAWRRTLADYYDPDTAPERIGELEKANPEYDLAAQIMAFPIERDHQIGVKLDVLAHYIVVGTDGAEPGDRFVYQAIHLLRADVAQLVA